MSVLAIDIGNTRIGLAVFTNGKSQDPAVRLTHTQLEADLLPTLQSLYNKAVAEAKEAGEDSPEVVIASVVPALSERIEHVVKQNLGVDAKRIGRELSIPLKTMLRDESTVGVDRLLGALCAYVNTETACVIISVGSALVVDAVDAEGIFRGGAILPGLAMAAKALHEYAAQLPEVSLTPPDQPFGRFTQEAINLGLFVGAQGAVRELIERYASALGSWPHVVATGGDAISLLSDTQLVDSFIPDLALQGAALVYEHHRQKE